MKEKDLVIKNVKHARCAICHIDELCVYDRELFFRRMGFKDFAEKAVALGYNVAETDFLKHMTKHLYVYQPVEAKEDDVSSEVILTAMIAAHRAQLKQMEEAGETSEYMYTKKSDMIKSLIELRGKFDGAYTQKKSDISKDFQTEMTEKLQESIGDPNDPDFAKYMASTMKSKALVEKRKKEEKLYESYEAQQ